MISPCVSLCELDRETMLCLGCGRSPLDKRAWKDDNTTDEWKEANLIDCQTKLTDIQLSYWKTSYKFKLQFGESMHKYGKRIKNET
jgi:predicted Fe-S protein YdhL (DUF1289 family)|tara:strand:- start:331 stop:588 length:258 start_codon:yes stop_codon:yes gene_type:complete